MKRFVFYLSLIFVVSVFASCQKDGKSIVTPVSSGRPYEVLVVADDKCWNSPDSALFHVLDTDVPGLPQPERSSGFREFVRSILTVVPVCSATSLLLIFRTSILRLNSSIPVMRILLHR